MLRPENHPYFSKRATLTSKHEKLALVGPEFNSRLALKVEEIPLDTDVLGTFSGEVERSSTPLETAIQKAKLGLDQTGYSLGIASEGSIGSDPLLPWIQSDYEVLVFLDLERDLIIHESFRSAEIVAAITTSRTDGDLEEFLRRADFPHHGLIVKSLCSDSPEIFKGINDLELLKNAIRRCAAVSRTGTASIESDFRANHSPSRRVNIAKTAALLANRVASLCPSCNTPGWGRVEYLKGVECSQCGDVNPEVLRQEILGCYKCESRELGAVLNTLIGPERCNGCNP